MRFGVGREREGVGGWRGGDGSGVVRVGMMCAMRRRRVMVCISSFGEKIKRSCGLKTIFQISEEGSI